MEGQQQPFVNCTSGRTFVIDYERNEFLKDGEVFRYVSGSLHYFRIPRPYWKDRIQKMKAAGLNAVTTYVEWSLHEPFPGVYNFEGMADLEYFMQLIKDKNMYLIFRPGPYICAERDLGGFPYWLLNVTPKKSLRTNDSIPVTAVQGERIWDFMVGPNILKSRKNKSWCVDITDLTFNHYPKMFSCVRYCAYKKYVSKWFNVLMPKVQPYLYGNGGNIIMVQVENEYGSYYACDSEYKRWLRDLLKGYVENKAVLFTIDVCGQSYIDCGYIPEVYATVDFGYLVNMTVCFDLMRNIQNGGPLVNSEYYAGWLSHWQEPLSDIHPDGVVDKMKTLLALNASFNFYMFHGGTNFGFTSGANTNDTTERVGYLPQLTSYDFNAPLDEAGDPTEKYFMIKKALEEKKYMTNYLSPIPSPKGAYGTFHVRPVVSFFEKEAQRIKSVTCDVSLSFEDMDINTGFVMYETILTNDQKNIMNPVNLTISTVRDRAIIYLDQVQVGTMTRLKDNTTISLNIDSSVQKLSILIENQGRINYGDFLEDRKGIFDRVILGNRVLGPWRMTAHPLNETSWLSSIEPVEHVQLPAFYRTHFTLSENYTTCLDTYLDTSGWTKGVAFLNEINLGRFWPLGGPQVTLYVPGVFLKPPPAINTLVMVELESAPQNLSVKFIDKPNLNGSIAL